MAMKKLLIFLHGKGANKEAHKAVVEKIAEALNAEMVAFNAPIPSPKYQDGYCWWNKCVFEGKRQMQVEEFNHSVDFILGNIEKELSKRNLSWDNLILCGHSQGGMMAMHLGLTGNPAKVISICGDFPEYLSYAVPVNKEVPIIWIAGEKDDFLSDERKNSYEILKKWGCNLRYVVSHSSMHNELDETEILEAIKG